MVLFLIRVAIFLGSSALGLWITSLVVSDFTLTLSGFLAAVIVFTIAQSVLSPFIAKMARRYASAFLGGIGLVSTYVALLIATLLTGGLEITGGVVTWIASVVLVWLITALATLLLPLLVVRKYVREHQAGAPTTGNQNTTD